MRPGVGVASSASSNAFQSSTRLTRFATGAVFKGMIGDLLVSILYEANALCDARVNAPLRLKKLVSILYEANALCDAAKAVHMPAHLVVSILYEANALCDIGQAVKLAALLMFQSSTRLTRFATERPGIAFGGNSHVSILYEANALCDRPRDH